MNLNLMDEADCVVSKVPGLFRPPRDDDLRVRTLDLLAVEAMLCRWFSLEGRGEVVCDGEEYSESPSSPDRMEPAGVQEPGERSSVCSGSTWCSELDCLAGCR